VIVAIRGATADPLAPATAESVARYLVLLADAGGDDPASEPDYLTPLRLQKLLYYVQGWSLAVNGRPMFNDPIEAWKYGPVVRSVYEVFKALGGGAVPANAGGSDGLSEGQRDLIERVWEAYKPYSASALADMSHDEEPWKRARADLSAGENSDAVIAVEDMRLAFTKLKESSKDS
jgi:uncharacterized phage-associated protein